MAFSDDLFRVAVEQARFEGKSDSEIYNDVEKTLWGGRRYATGSVINLSGLASKFSPWVSGSF